MTTKRSTTQKSHISLQRAAELARNLAALQAKSEVLLVRANDQQNRITALEDRVAFLTKQSSDAYCTAELNGKAVVELAKKQSIDAARISDIEAQWRQHSKVSMERYQEVRSLQSSLMDTNERVRVVEATASIAKHDGINFRARLDDLKARINPDCQPGHTLKEWQEWAEKDPLVRLRANREDLWVAMGYCSERLKVEIHGPFTYSGAKEFCNDARYSDYAVLPLEE